MGAFWFAPRLAHLHGTVGRAPAVVARIARFSGVCPACGVPGREDAAHLLLYCAAWNAQRGRWLQPAIVSVVALMRANARVNGLAAAIAVGLAQARGDAARPGAAGAADGPDSDDGDVAGVGSDSDSSYRPDSDDSRGSPPVDGSDSEDAVAEDMLSDDVDPPPAAVPVLALATTNALLAITQNLWGELAAQLLLGGRDADLAMPGWMPRMPAAADWDLLRRAAEAEDALAHPDAQGPLLPLPAAGRSVAADLVSFLKAIRGPRAAALIAAGFMPRHVRYLC